MEALFFWHLCAKMNEEVREFKHGLASHPISTPLFDCRTSVILTVASSPFFISCSGRLMSAVAAGGTHPRCTACNQ